MFASTANQASALQPLLAKLPNAHLLGVGGFGEEQLPVFWAYLLALPFAPLLFFRWAVSGGHQRRSWKYALDMYWLAPGLYLVARMVIRRLHPSVVVVANDHIMWCRIVLRASRDEGVTTVYVQHASVTEHFPPLDVDIALLEGRDAALKYASAGPSRARVYLVGNARLDGLEWRPTRRGRWRAVGICTGTRETIAAVREMCEAVRSGLGDLEIVLRPHPGDRRWAAFGSIARDLSLGFSDSREESAGGFLSRVDAIVAGESNVLLEAALLDVLPIYYPFREIASDHYGFQRNGLVTLCQTSTEVVSLLREHRDLRPDLGGRAKHFCATVGTRFEGRSAELAAEAIMLAAGNAGTVRWVSLEITGLPAVYEPAP